MAEPGAFGILLRGLRVEAGLTQEELAAAAALSVRSVSDLERGVNQTARRESARLLAQALGLTGPERAEFEAVARGRAPVPPARTSKTAAIRTLPRDITSFTGREAELRELVEVAAAAASGEPARIHAIGGMAGVGKTAFAVRAAHLLAEHFPDGQLFLSLNGHTPGQRPADPADALASLLFTAGVPIHQIPPDVAARAAVWRDWVAGKQLLLVLDDAVDSEQVRPLLPGTAGSLVLVTSRRHLSALEDASVISLDILPADEAVALLVRLAGRAGLSPPDAPLAEIARLCGYLPLAIGMLARQLHHHPAWRPADLAAELAGAQDRTELMVTENMSVAAAFNLSYQDLGPGPRRLFRRLSLHPGNDIDAYAAAALDETDLATARRHLHALYDLYLLSEVTHGRYRLHDLIRGHSGQLARREDSAADRDQALDRLLRYYGAATEAADLRLARYHRPVAAAGAPAAVVPRPGTRDEALGWLRSERDSILACIDRAAADSRTAAVVRLTAAMASFLRQQGPLTQAVALHDAAIAAARSAGDRLGQASALHELGRVKHLTGDYSPEYLEAALALYRDLGSQLGEANALNGLGCLHYLTSEYDVAADLNKQALALYRDLGDKLGEANSLWELARVEQMTGDYRHAADLLGSAAAAYRELGDRMGEANTLFNLGSVQLLVCDYPGAAGFLEESLALYRSLEYQIGQANCLETLGRALSFTGDYPAAAGVLTEALTMNTEIANRLGQVNTYKDLGRVRLLTGHPAEAQTLLETGLALSRGIGARLGEGNLLLTLCELRRAAGDTAAATALAQEALALYQDLGEPSGEADALSSLGELRAEAGRAEEAMALHQRALALTRRVQNPGGEARALEGIARGRLQAGDRSALAELRAAVATYQRLGVPEAAAAADYLRAVEHDG